jgi:dCTP deaminase
MIYTRPHIEQAIANGSIVIKGYKPENLGTNSLDLTLGNEFWQVHWDSGEPYFIFDKYELGEEVEIPNNGTLLAWSNELVWSGDGIVASLRNRSSTRRLGVSVCMCAGLGDVGFGGNWVVELSGHVGGANEPCPYLTVGEPFCQLVFEQAMPMNGDSHYSGQYGAMVKPSPIMMLPKRYRSEKYTFGYDWTREKQ